MSVPAGGTLRALCGLLPIRLLPAQQFCNEFKNAAVAPKGLFAQRRVILLRRRGIIADLLGNILRFAAARITQHLPHNLEGCTRKFPAQRQAVKLVIDPDDLERRLRIVGLAPAVSVKMKFFAYASDRLIAEPLSDLHDRGDRRERVAEFRATDRNSVGSQIRLWIRACKQSGS